MSVFQSGILLQQESFSILMNISCPGSWELPEHMAGLAEPRKDPGRYRLDRWSLCGAGTTES